MKTATLYDPQVHLVNSRTTQALLELGKRQQWAFSVLGIAPMPTEPVSLSKWMIVPAHLDTSPIPEQTMKRIQAIYAAGIRPQGFVVAHEKPNQIPASIPETVEGEFVVRPGYDFTIDVGKVVNVGFKLVGAVAVAGLAVAGVVLPAAFAVGSALLLDPILIAVADNVWTEVDRWWE
ncbi:MAG: hypothetical protein KIT46_09095 [Anaerolineales bacterium]|nr:hypothetical protein [Anaerolineales bacterium]